LTLMLVVTPVRADSFEPAVRTVTVGAPGGATFWLDPAMSWYSSEFCYCSLVISERVRDFSAPLALSCEDRTLSWPDIQYDVVHECQS
jgi:hypothetical protein